MARKLLGERRDFALLLLPLLIPSVSLSASSGTESASLTVAAILVYGLPEETVETFIGAGKVQDLISLNIGGGWMSGDDFQRNLIGRTVDSGNAYRVENGDRVYDPSNPVKHDDILRDGGVNFPLNVIMTHPDIHLVFTRNGHQFTTDFELSQQDYDQPVVEIWSGRTGAVPIFGLIGSYALENGVVINNGDGGWVPAPIIENNSLLRARGEEYSVSLVIVYSFPFD